MILSNDGYSVEHRDKCSVEITYNSGEKYTAYLADESYENVIACLLDDVSVSVSHSIDAE